jgi:hypothetical protein
MAIWAMGITIALLLLLSMCSPDSEQIEELDPEVLRAANQ